MSFKFRKRIRLFPGCTINFSKSGISTTLGIKGLSVNIGKKGAYLNTGIPGTGIYDRVKISGSNGNNGVSNKVKSNDGNYNIQDNNIYYSIKSDENSDITAEGMQELKEQLLNAYNEKKLLHDNWQKAYEKRRSIRFKQILLKMIIVGFFMPSLDEELDEAIDIQEQAWEEYNNYNYEFEFKTDEYIDKLFNELTVAFDELAKSDRIWDITDSRYADSYRERTAEGTRVVLRKVVSLSKGKLDFIKSKHDALIFENANGGNIYIYPGFAIMYNGSIENSAFIDYPSVVFTPDVVRFTENDGYIPSDAKQVDIRYRYENKNGEPDRRFSYNPTYPVMAYGKYTLMSKKGLYEEFQFSNVDSAIAFAKMYNEFLQGLIKQSKKDNLQALIENSNYFDNPDNYLNRASKYAKQGFEALRMSDYEYANELFDKALTENVKDSIAYLGKLLCEHKVSNVNDLMNSVEIIRVDNAVKNNFDIGQSENFKKVKELSLEIKNVEQFAGLYHIQLEALYNAIMKYYSQVNSAEEVNIEELKALKKGIEQINEKFEYKDLKDKEDEIQGIIDELTNNKDKISNNGFDEEINNNSDEKFASNNKITDIVFLLPIIFLIYILINNAINPSTKNYYVPNNNNMAISETSSNVDNNNNKSTGNKDSPKASNNLTPKTVGWVQYGNDWYYYNENGVMVANGWINSNGNLYCFGADGRMYKNTWIDYNNQLFYVDETGKMLSNQWVGNKYVGADGVMLRNSITPDGYYVGVDGNYISTNVNNNVNNNNWSGETKTRDTNKNYKNSNSGSTNNASTSSKKISFDYVKPTDVRKSLSNGESLVIDFPIPVFSGNGSEKLNNLTKSKQNEIFDAFLQMAEDSLDEEVTEYGTRKIYISSIDFYQNTLTYQDDDIVEVENEGQVNWSNGDTDKITMLLTYNKKDSTLEYTID